MASILFTVTLSIAWAVHRHTAAELAHLTKDQLIDLVLDLEHQLFDPNHDEWGCQSYSPLNGETGDLLVPVKHPGYADHGTLKWPNGNVFLLRHNDYADDWTLKYPDGKVLQLRHEDYANDHTLYWSNGNVLQLRNKDYVNDRTIYRHDKSIWLKRNKGYVDDRQRFGLPMESFTDGNIQSSARLTSNDEVTLRVTVTDELWKVVLDVHSNTDHIQVTECFRHE